MSHKVKIWQVLVDKGNSSIQLSLSQAFSQPITKPIPKPKLKPIHKPNPMTKTQSSLKSTNPNLNPNTNPKSNPNTNPNPHLNSNLNPNLNPNPNPKKNSPSSPDPPPNNSIAFSTQQALLPNTMSLNKKILVFFTDMYQSNGQFVSCYLCTQLLRFILFLWGWELVPPLSPRVPQPNQLELRQMLQALDQLKMQMNQNTVIETPTLKSSLVQYT